MRRFGRSLLYAVCGFPAGAVLGYAVVALLSGNTHDLSLEATMTAIFVAGPIGAILAFVIGLTRGH
jgi:predicted membrane protein